MRIEQRECWEGVFGIEDCLACVGEGEEPWSREWLLGGLSKTDWVWAGLGWIRVVRVGPRLNWDVIKGSARVESRDLLEARARNRQQLP